MIDVMDAYYRNKKYIHFTENMFRDKILKAIVYYYNLYLRTDTYAKSLLLNVDTSVELKGFDNSFLDEYIDKIEVLCYNSNSIEANVTVYPKLFKVGYATLFHSISTLPESEIEIPRVCIITYEVLNTGEICEFNDFIWRVLGFINLQGYNLKISNSIDYMIFDNTRFSRHKDWLLPVLQESDKESVIYFKSILGLCGEVEAVNILNCNLIFLENIVSGKETMQNIIHGNMLGNALRTHIKKEMRLYLIGAEKAFKEVLELKLKNTKIKIIGG